MTSLMTMLAIVGSFVVVDATPALAASIPISPTSHVDIVGGGEGVSTADASGFENLNLNFDYDINELEAQGDTFEYGWRTTGGVNNILGTIAGETNAGGVPGANEIGSVTIAITDVAAQAADLEIYFKTNGGRNDEITISNISLSGDLATTPPADPITEDTTQDPINDDQTPLGAGEKVTLCHVGEQGVNPHAISVSFNSIVNGSAHAGASHNSDIIPAFYYQTTPQSSVEFYAGRNWDAAGYSDWQDCAKEGVIDEDDLFAYVHLTKVVTNDQTVDLSLFTLTVNGEDFINGQIVTIPVTLDAPTEVTVTETAIPEGYELVGIECVLGEQVFTGTESVSLMLTKSNVPDCTVTNRKIGDTPDVYVSKCLAPNDNLLSNASFEDPVADANTVGGGMWEIFASIPGWAATNGIEIWNNMFQGPSDGEQNAELDPNQSTKITQDVVTVPGTVYELRFDFAGREGRDATENHVIAGVNGLTLIDEATADTDWVTYGQTFTATTSTTTVSFEDAGISNSFGTLIDNAVLCVVEEPITEPKTSTVTICKYDQHQTPLSAWQLALMGDEVATHEFLVDGSAQQLSVVPAGSYVLKADGAYEYRGSTGLLADARFSERMAGDAGFGTYPFQPWRITNPATGGLAVSVDGDEGALWGSMYSALHVYYGGITHAANGDIALSMYDDNYTDNVGTIDLTLYEGYAGATGSDGCLTFEAVPYGNYVLDEVLPPEWENISGLGNVVVDDATESFTVVNRDPSIPVDTCEVGFTVDFGDDTTVFGYQTTGTTAGAFTVREIPGGYEVALRENATNDDRVAANGMIFFQNADLSGAVITKGTGNDKFENGSGNTELDTASIVGNAIEFDLQVTNANDVFTITGIEKDCEVPDVPSLCRLPFIVTFGEDSHETSYSTVEGTEGLVISEVSGGYQIALNDDDRGGVYRVYGTIVFPEGVDLSGLTQVETGGDNGLEQTHSLYPDIFTISGNVITFDFNVNGANDEITITGSALYGQDCDTPPEMCYLDYVVTFDDESDITTEIVAGEGGLQGAGEGVLIVMEDNGQLTVAFMHQSDNAFLRAKGTITFPVGTDLSGVTFADVAPYDGLEFGNGFAFPDTFEIVGNTLVFDLYVTSGDDVQTLIGDVIYNTENCDEGTNEEEEEEEEEDTTPTTGGGGAVVYGGGGSSNNNNDDDDDNQGRVAGDSITLEDVIDELRKRIIERYGVGGSVLGEQVSVVPFGAPNAGAGGAVPVAVPSFFFAQFANVTLRRDVW